MMSWEELFTNMTYLVATKSHDPRTKIGAVITTQDHMILSIGYNGLPRGVEYNSDVLNSTEKYKVMCHAEENAILNASRAATSLINSRLYVNLTPCNNCARMIIQSGIQEVYIHANGQDMYEKSSDKVGHNWEESFKCTKELFSAANISTTFFQYQGVTTPAYFNGKTIDFSE